jgi:adenylate cyclase
VAHLGPARRRIQRRRLATVLLVAAVITPVFNVTTSEPGLVSALHGLLDAVLITLAVGGYLFFVRDGWLRPRLRRLSFGASLLVSGAIVLALFLVGRATGQVVMTGEPRRFLTSFTEPHLAWALPYFVALALGVEFVLQMNRMIGASVLRYFVTGAYHRPRREERVFLFLDLVGSTGLAERLGSTAYFALLQRLVDDVSEPILATEGEIYQYAGDEIVITWPLARGLRAANCLRCFFAVREALAAGAEAYRRDFGAVPRFRAGLHGGPVTAGELGDLRRQIVFAGDVLNAAARLEEHAKQDDLDLVVSGALLERIALPAGLQARRVGELALRGKQEPVVAFALSGALRDA